MIKVLIGIGAGVIVFTAIILGLVYGNTNEGPMKLIAICNGEGTKSISCTWIPFDESKRTPEEKALAR
jgi:hypothetical protein